MLREIVWDVVTLGAHAFVVILCLFECRHPLRFPAWSVAWAMMLLSQSLGLSLRVGNMLHAHGWSVRGWPPPDWLLDRALPLCISLALLYFLIVIHRMFDISTRMKRPPPEEYQCPPT